MRNALSFLVVVLLSFSSIAQSFKKKHFGVYEGVIGGYTMEAGTEVVTVLSASITIELTSEGIVEQIGTLRKKGAWKLVGQTKNHYILEATWEGFPEERFVVFKKEKVLERKGLFPQPDARLTKKERLRNFSRD